MSPGEIFEALAEQMEHPASYKPSPGRLLPQHPVDELEHWACFRPEEPKVRRNPVPLPVRQVQARAGAKVGRNAPRLCGSGKKYKKCCGA
jgi:hypothetical protein